MVLQMHAQKISKWVTDALLNLGLCTRLKTAVIRSHTPHRFA